MVLRAKSILPSRRVRVLSAHCGFVVALDALPNLPAASIFQVRVFFGWVSDQGSNATPWVNKALTAGENQARSR